MENHSRKIFVNLAVRDLPRSKDFFRALGFDFDPRFTDEKAACMIVSSEAFVLDGHHWEVVWMDPKALPHEERQ